MQGGKFLIAAPIHVGDHDVNHDSADKKVKETEKQKGVLLRKSLLTDSNASRERSQDVMKNGISKEESNIQKVKEKLGLLNYDLMHLQSERI